MQKTQSKTLSLKTKAAVTIIILILVSTAVVQGTLRIQDPTGSINGYWEGEKYIRNSNGKTWTATGDNLQAAIWDLNDTGGTVWLPSCTMTVSNVRIDAGHINIIGTASCSWSDFRVPSGTVITNDGGVMFNATGNVSDSPSGNIFSVSIKNIHFMRDSRDYTGDVITVKNTHDVSIEDCTFHLINGSCILFDEPCYTTNVIQCLFGRCGGLSSGVIKYMNDTTFPNVQRCVFEGPQYLAIQGEVYSNSAAGARIIDNFFEGSVDDSIPTFGFIYGMLKGCVIKNNVFTRSSPGKGYGIYLDGSAYSAVISSNSFGLMDVPIYVDDNIGHLVITDNEIYNENKNYDTYAILCDTSQAAISGNRVYGGGIKSGSNSIITDNKVCYADEGIKSNGYYSIVSKNIIRNINGTGIYINRHSTASGNSITNVSGYGIDAYENSCVSNNFLYDITGDAAIHISMKNISVTGNTIKYFSKYGIYSTEIKRATINDNVVVNGSDNGIMLRAYNSSISSNTICDIECNGIYFMAAEHCVIESNVITDIGPSSWVAGIFLQYAYNNSISLNRISGCSRGIYLLSPCSNNLISSNMLSDNIDDIQGDEINSIVLSNYGDFAVFPTSNTTGIRKGFAWFNTTSNELNVYNGTAWVSTTLT